MTLASLDFSVGAFVNLALLLALGWVLFTLFGVWFTANRLRNPPRKTYGSALARNEPGDPSELPEPLAYVEYTYEFDTNPFIKSRWGRSIPPSTLPAWHVTGSKPDGPVIVAIAGWSDSRVGLVSRLPTFAAHASSIVVLDLPGQGEAPGLCTLGIEEPALIQGVLTHMGIPPKSGPDKGVVLYGASLGSGVMIAAAAQHARHAKNNNAEPWPRLLGVIAEAPYRMQHTAVYNVMQRAGKPWRIQGRLAMAALGLRLGVGAKWANYDRAHLAQFVTCPLLVLHGEQDQTCPLADGHDIAAGAPNGKLAAIEGAGHNNLWKDDFRQASHIAVSKFLAPLASC